MKLTETIQGSPLRVQRSIRGDNSRVLTSCQPGKIVPLTYVPLLREDAVRSGQVGISVRMAETIHPLINAVNVRAYAHLIPTSALEHFAGMDDFNRRYSQNDGFIKTREDSSLQLFNKVMGIHHAPYEKISGHLSRSYNTLVNFRRSARSKHLPLRSENTAVSLARAFWSHPILWDVVPDYEEALIDGDVPLTLSDVVAGGTIGVRGAWLNPSGDGRSGFKDFDGEKTLEAGTPYRHFGGSGNAYLAVESNLANGDGGHNLHVTAREIMEELQAGGFRLSLANIEMAKQTVAFAKLRQQYQGIDDEKLIDLLMDGIRVPPEALKQPLLLARASGVVTMSERFATDGASLDMSRTTGVCNLNLRYRLPPVNTGGLILITLEITPEPLYERLNDPWLRVIDTNDYPQFLRDYLDPKKVEVVENRDVDVLHSDPDGLFGYRGLNRKWDRDFVRAGGKFLRPTNDSFVEDRQRFWTVESNDPQLTEDFYLVSSDLKNTPFADQVADPFEILTISQNVIEGNTVFGKQLQEDNGDYEAIIDRVTEKEDD